MERVRIRDLEKQLNVSRATLNRWLRRGMPSQKVGGVRLFDPKQVEEWIATRAHAQEKKAGFSAVLKQLHERR